MLDNYIIIVIIVCATLLTGYIAKLLFISKCDDVNLFCLKIHRKTEQEIKNVSDFKIPISN